MVVSKKATRQNCEDLAWRQAGYVFDADGDTTVHEDEEDKQGLWPVLVMNKW